MPVKKITKKFNYSKKDLIELVLKIDDYKNFLPWCINSKIQTIDKNKDNLKITADLEIGFKTFREVYTSKVLYNNKTSKIEVTSVSGNIKKLSNIWMFKDLDKKSCEISFFIEIELNNYFLNKMLERFFDIGFEKIFSSFENRAKKILI